MFKVRKHHGEEYLLEVEHVSGNFEMMDIKRFLTVDRRRSIKATQSVLHTELDCQDFPDVDLDKYVEALFLPEGEFEAAKAKLEAHQRCECAGGTA